MKRNYKHLSNADRIRIETLLNKGSSVQDIANYLHVHRSTIYREIKRGQYMHRNSDYTEELRYSSDKGQQIHDWNAQGKGRELKIGNDIKYAKFLERKIIKDKYSPEAAVVAASESENNFETSISVRTLYRYIKNRVLFQTKNGDLPMRGKRKKSGKKNRTQKRAAAGESIENRPKKVEDRLDFGHWEMDTVKGKLGITKSCILVLTERMTRMEIVIKLKDQKSDSVVSALDQIEKEWGDMFRNVFKTITVDNGVEFSNNQGMERSILRPGEQRTNIYYCHPYCSWERGSNENQNKLIRRHIPKGEDFDDVTDAEIKYIEDWINEYPRKIFGFKTARSLFLKEVEKLRRERSA